MAFHLRNLEDSLGRLLWYKLDISSYSLFLLFSETSSIPPRNSESASKVCNRKWDFLSFLQCLFLIYFNKCGLYYFLDKASVYVSRAAGGDGCLSLCFQSKLSTRASAEAMEWRPIPNGNSALPKQPFQKLQNSNHTANFKDDGASKAIQQAHFITDSPLLFHSSGIASAVRDFCSDMANEEVKENMLLFY